MCRTSMRTRLFLPGSLVAVAILVAGCFPSESEDRAQTAPPPPVVTVAKPVVRDVIEDDEFIGRFEAVAEVEVRSRVGGYLKDIHFMDGAFVDEGDLLFTIDQRPFETALAQAQSQVSIAESQIDFAEAQLRRAEELAERGNIPAATVDERRQSFLAAQAELEGARAAVDRAELDLEYTEITAPISGRIDRRLVTPGNLVQTDQTVLTTIVSLDPIDFYFDIDERSFLAYARDARSQGESLQEGSGGITVRVRVADNSEPPFEGTLNFAENRIDDATGTARVRARVPNSDFVLQPGLFGRVNIPGSLPYVGILVPEEAIASDQNRRVVYVVDDAGLVGVRVVVPGPRLHGYRVVREGLTGDETVVINGLMRIRPGVTVTPEMVELPPEADNGQS